MKWWCYHDWSEWSAVITSYSGNYQYRKCLKCGKLHKRKIGLEIEGSSEHINKLEFKGSEYEATNRK